MVLEGAPFLIKSSIMSSGRWTLDAGVGGVWRHIEEAVHTALRHQAQVTME